MIYFSIISFLNVKIGNKKVVEKRERETKMEKLPYILIRELSLFSTSLLNSLLKGKYIYHVVVVVEIRKSQQHQTTSRLG